MNYSDNNSYGVGYECHSCKSIKIDDGDLSMDCPVLYTCCLSPFSISKSQLTVEACLMEEGNYDECHSSAWHYIY